MYAFAGMPYIDDNSPRQNSPLRLSIALAARNVKVYRTEFQTSLIPKVITKRMI